MVAKINNKVRGLNSLKLWSAITGVALTVALVLTFLPVQVAVNTDGMISISLRPTQTRAQEPNLGEVIGLRTRTSKTSYLGNGTYKLASSLGAVHYLNNQITWQDINNKIVPAQPPWNYEMAGAGYNVSFLSDFTYGQIIKWEKDGKYVTLQPMELQWTNNLGQISTISSPQNVTVSINNTPMDLLIDVDTGYEQGTIRWDDAYGAGRDFWWACNPDSLNDFLRLDSAPPTPPQNIIDGKNPSMRLSFIFAPSADVDIYVNGTLWNKSTTVQTFDAIDFRSDSTTLWSFASASYWGSEIGNETWTPVYAWTVPDSTQGTNWLNPNNARDDNTVTTADISIPALRWSDYLELSLITPILCNSTRVYSNGGAQVNAIQVDVFYNGAWTNIYDGALIKGSYRTYNIPAGQQLVSAMRIRYWNSHASATRTANCGEGQLWGDDPEPAKGVQGAVTTLRKVGTDLWIDALVPYGWLKYAVYPVFIDPTFSVAASSDDCGVYWNGTAWVLSALTITLTTLGKTGSTWYKSGGGFRFTDVTIPQGTTIDAANLTFIAGSTLSTTTVNARITGEDVDNATTWSTLADYQARRGTVVGGANNNYITTAQVDWDGIAAWTVETSYQSPSIVSVIQEIVNRAGWASGNALALWVDDHDNRATARRQISTWDHATYAPPALYVEYTSAAPEITNSPDSWAVGVIPVNTSTNTTINYFTLNNTGNCAVDITIQGTNLTGGDDTWILSSNATPGENIYGLYAGKDDADDLFDVVVNTTANLFVSSLAEDATQAWGLNLTMPTSLSGYDAQQMSGTVTLIASAA